MVITVLRRDVAKRAEQEAALSAMFERGFADITGFIGGIWTYDEQANELMLLHGFDSESNARKFVDLAQANAARQTALGLDLVSARIAEVLGTA